MENDDQAWNLSGTSTPFSDKPKPDSIEEFLCFLQLMQAILNTTKQFKTQDIDLVLNTNLRITPGRKNTQNLNEISSVVQFGKRLCLIPSLNYILHLQF